MQQNVKAPGGGRIRMRFTASKSKMYTRLRGSGMAWLAAEGGGASGQDETYFGAMAMTLRASSPPEF